MRDVLGELLDILSLERIEEHLFRGRSQDLGWGRIFGGQVLGQALSAAEQTVPAGRAVHSLHAYFLRSGDASMPVVYTVDPIRGGRSFTTRRVVAIQRGRPIFNLSASFQIEEPGFEHASEMPDVIGPENLKDERTLMTAYMDQLPATLQAKIPQGMRDRATLPRPIEVRPVDPLDPLKPEQRPPRRRVWFKASGPLPDRASVHQYLLAYASDFYLLGSTMHPHRVTWMNPGMQVASVDHAMWFHRPFRFDDWLLYDIESPSASNARGLALGRFYDRAGRLVASTAQEGLIRDRRGEKRPNE